MQAGLSRIREVLRPGGRAAFAAWGPPETNQLFGPFRGAIAPYMSEPPAPPEPDTPNPMRFAEPGSLSAALSAAGFQDIREETPTLTMVTPGPPQMVVDQLLDVSRVEDNVPADRREALRADILAAYEPFARGDETHLRARIVIASGAA